MRTLVVCCVYNNSNISSNIHLYLKLTLIISLLPVAEDVARLRCSNCRPASSEPSDIVRLCASLLCGASTLRQQRGKTAGSRFDEQTDQQSTRSFDSVTASIKSSL